MRRLAFLAGLALAVAAAPPAAAEAFAEAIGRAGATGGTLALPGGDHGALVLRNLSPPEGRPLRLTAADPADPPRFSALLVRGSRNIQLEGLVFDYTYRPGDAAELRPFRIEGSGNVTLRGLVFDGDLAGEGDDAARGAPTAFGLSIRGVGGLTLADSTIRGFLRGLVVSQSRDVTVRGNDLWGMRSDGMDYAEVQRVVIEGNRIRDFAPRHPDSRDHPDMIQFWTARTRAPSQDITIRANLLSAGTGPWTQSIFMRNEMVDSGQAGDEMFYRRVTIEDNLIVNAHLHGITVGATDGLSIPRNTLVRNPPAQGGRGKHSPLTPRISVAAAARGVTIVANAAAALPDAEGRPGWQIARNLIVQDATRTRPNFYATVFAGSDPADPASFLPRPGGPLDGTGIGAPVARLLRETGPGRAAP